MNKQFEWCNNGLIFGPYFCLCLDEKQYLKQVKKLGVYNYNQFVNNGSDATCHYFTNSNNELTCIVCLSNFDNKSNIQIYGLLVHEAVHIWQEFKNKIGEINPSVEFEAYAIQSISQELFKSFERQK